MSKVLKLRFCLFNMAQKKVNLQANFQVAAPAYKKLVLAALETERKPAVSSLLKAIIEKATEQELKTILSR